MGVQTEEVVKIGSRPPWRHGCPTCRFVWVDVFFKCLWMPREFQSRRIKFRPAQEYSIRRCIRRISINFYLQVTIFSKKAIIKVWIFVRFVPQILRICATFFHLKNYFEVRYFKVLNLDHVGVQFFIWSAIRPTVLHGTKFSTWRYPDTFHYALEIQLQVRYFKVLHVHVAETGSYPDTWFFLFIFTSKRFKVLNLNLVVRNIYYHRYNYK